MASLLWTILLLCMAAPYLKADDKHVGEACTASDKCVDPGNFCDPNTNNQCAEIGAKKVGKLCTPGSNPGPEDDTVCGALATTFLECTGNANTECACKSGYTGEKNGVCTPAAGALGGACKPDGSCTDATSVCDTDTKCKLKVGGDCGGANSQNCAAGSECKTPGNKCACTAAGNVADSTGLCKAPVVSGSGQTPAAGALGGDCTSVACTDAKWVCDTDTDTKCKLKAGGGCTAANGANCVTGTTCKTDKCVCTLPKVANQTSGLCIDVPAGKMGYPCTTGNKDKNCPSAKHLKCDDVKKECICDTGFSGSRGGDCNSGSAALTSVTSLALVALFWASRHLLKE